MTKSSQNIFYPDFPFPDLFFLNFNKAVVRKGSDHLVHFLVILVHHFTEMPFMIFFTGIHNGFQHPFPGFNEFPQQISKNLVLKLNQ